jgi:hypothetical protein
MFSFVECKSALLLVWKTAKARAIQIYPIHHWTNKTIMVQACAKWSWLSIKPIALDNVIIPKVVSTNLVELDRSKTAAFSGPIWGRAGQQIWCSAPDPWAAKLLRSRCSPYSTRRRCGPYCSYRENILDLCWELLYHTATAYFVRKRPVL